jgi:hypothetical protein
MKAFLVRGVIAAVLFLSGCAAAPPPSTAATVLAKYKGHSAVACAYFVNEEVDYMEERFMSDFHKSSTFQGVWNAAPELSSQLSGTLATLGIKSRELAGVIGSGSASSYVAEAAAPLLRVNVGTPEWTALMGTNGGLTQERARLLVAGGYTQMVELIFPRLSAGNPLASSARVSTFVYLRITDLQTKNITFLGKVLPMQDIALNGKGVKEAFESNNLAGLKNYTKSVMRALPSLYVYGPDETPKLANAPI